jgi:hypothetical protein
MIYDSTDSESEQSNAEVPHHHAISQQVDSQVQFSVHTLTLTLVLFPLKNPRNFEDRVTNGRVGAIKLNHPVFPEWQ